MPCLVCALEGLDYCGPKWKKLACVNATVDQIDCLHGLPEVNAQTEKDHFLVLFMYQMLARLSSNGWYSFLDRHSVYT